MRTRTAAGSRTEARLVCMRAALRGRDSRRRSVVVALRILVSWSRQEVTGRREYPSPVALGESTASEA